MKWKLYEKRTIRRYLLGDLKGSKLERLEKRFMTDAGYAELVAELERNLADEYAAGMLSSKERAKVERSFLLTPQGREKIRFARALNRFISENDAAEASSEDLAASSRTASTTSFLRYRAPLIRYAVSITVLLLLLSAWLAFKMLRLQNQSKINNQNRLDLEAQVAELRGENDRLVDELRREREQRDALERELTPPVSNVDQNGSSIASGNKLAMIVLAPGRVRSKSNGGILVINQSSARAQFRLLLESDDHISFKAVLHASEGSEIWTSPWQAASKSGTQKSVSVTLSVNLLPQGDYFFQLTGKTEAANAEEEIGKYYFKVVVR